MLNFVKGITRLITWRVNFLFFTSFFFFIFFFKFFSFFVLNTMINRSSRLTVLSISNLSHAILLQDMHFTQQQLQRNLTKTEPKFYYNTSIRAMRRLSIKRNIFYPIVFCVKLSWSSRQNSRKVNSIFDSSFIFILSKNDFINFFDLSKS